MYVELRRVCYSKRWHWSLAGFHSDGGPSGSAWRGRQNPVACYILCSLDLHTGLYFLNSGFFLMWLYRVLRIFNS